MSLETFNALEECAAREQLMLCCSADAWITGMLARRPFASRAALIASADSVWASMQESDLLDAFAGHPKIGDVASLKAKYAASGALAASEQAGVGAASDALIERLAQGNARYEMRFGFIFIVCASGKSAGEMCDLLETRLANGRELELRLAAEEQRKILQLRLEKLL